MLSDTGTLRRTTSMIQAAETIITNQNGHQRHNTHISPTINVDRFPNFLITEIGTSHFCRHSFQTLNCIWEMDNKDVLNKARTAMNISRNACRDTLPSLLTESRKDGQKINAYIVINSSKMYALILATSSALGRRAYFTVLEDRNLLLLLQAPTRHYPLTSPSALST